MSGSGFSNPIVGGGGALVIPAIRSPNYNPALNQGWTINKDGSATFYSISLPGFTAGVKATFSSTQPPAPNVGDLWYNTAAGLALSQWNGSAWVPHQIGTGAIAPNAVTPALQAIGDTANPNPYFAGGDVSNWSTTAGVLNFTGIPTAGAVAYPFAGEITCNPGAAFPGIIGTFFAANPGDPVQVNGWFQCNASVQFGIQYYDAAFNFLGENITIVPAGGWQYAQIAGTVIGGATQAVLFVGVNNGSATGSEVIDCTALTVLTKINGGLLTPGSTINSPIISAGTFMGSVFEGTNWLENANGQFMYSGTPALGNLILSIAPTATTDPFGNGVPAGFWVYFAGDKIGLYNQGTSPAVMAIPASASISAASGMFAFITAAGLATEQVWLALTSGKESGNSDAAIQVVSASADNSLPAKMIFEFGGAIWGTLQAATGLIADAWHNIALDAGWTSVVTPQYRFLPDGNVEARGQATHAGFTVATNINNSNPLAAAYRPAATRVYRPPVAGDAAATVAMGTGGVFQARASGFTATQVFLDGTYSI